MFSGQHDIDQDPQSIDIGGRVRLGQAVLFRRGESGGAENLGIGFMTGLVKPGGVKIDQDRIGTAKHNVFRFYIPVYRAHGMEYPERAAELFYDRFCFLRRKQGVLQKNPHIVALDIFLQHQILIAVGSNLQSFGKVWTFIA